MTPILPRIRVISSAIPEVYSASSVADFLNGGLEVPKRIRMLSPFNALTFGKTYSFDDRVYVFFENSPCLNVSDKGLIIYDVTGRVNVEAHDTVNPEKLSSGRYDSILTIYESEDKKLLFVSGRRSNFEQPETEFEGDKGLDSILA